MKHKSIIFDASSLISIAMNSLLLELGGLKKFFTGKFVITKEVKYEIIDKPIKIKRFALEALRLNDLIVKGVLEFPSSVGISDDEVSSETKNVLKIANSAFYGRDEEIKLISSGEASCVALSKLLNEKGVENVMAVDERTLRSLIETPKDLKKFLQRKFHTAVDVNKDNLKFFEGLKLIRSTELAYVAWKKKIARFKGLKGLDSMLWALKFKGCSINEKEIREIKGIG